MRSQTLCLCFYGDLQCYLLLCGGAISFAMAHTNGTCIARTWTTVLRSILLVVPLIVKVSAINRIMSGNEEGCEEENAVRVQFYSKRGVSSAA